MLPGFGLWCSRYADHFTAVGAAFYTTATVNASRFSAVGVGDILTIFTAVVAAFYATARVNTARFSAVGVGDILSILLLLLPPFTLRRWKMLPDFRPLV